LDVEDMKNPDERSVMTYVSEYFHRFASQDQKQVAAQRCANFLKFLREVKARQDEYERRARALLTWVDERVGEFKNREFGATLGEAQEFQAALRAFVVTARPAQEGEKIDLENLFAEIQTQLKVNNRRPYVPPEGLAPEELEAALDALTAAQKAYAAAVRENRFRFVQRVETKVSDEKIAEMKDSFKHFDKNKTGDLDRLEFKAALSAMSVFFSSDAELERVFNNLSAGSGRIGLETYIGFLTSKYEDKDSPDQIKDSFRQVADGSVSISRAQLLTPPLDPADAEFLASVMPAAGGGYDYVAYVDSVFS